MKSKIFSNQVVLKEFAESESHVISPVSAVHKFTKPRLILDLSYLNQFLTVPNLSLKILDLLKVFFYKGDYFFKFDQARSHNEANEAVASPKISKKNLPQMKNS